LLVPECHREYREQSFVSRPWATADFGGDSFFSRKANPDSGFGFAARDTGSSQDGTGWPKSNENAPFCCL
jgi:hypothetical protein